MTFKLTLHNLQCSVLHSPGVLLRKPSSFLKKMINPNVKRLLLTLCMIFFNMTYSRADEIPSMSAHEQDALYSVMESMAGSIDWKALHPHPCTEDLWPGLVCEQGTDGLLHVTRLDFGYKPNPPCAPNASVPATIAKLSHLRSLFIFECFSSVNISFPTSLVKLAPTLQELSLRTNSALVGSIPIEISNLTSLQLLSLSQNSLSGHIPAEISKLTALQHLDLSSNLLTGELPTELGSLHNLVILDLSVNSLRGRVPPSLGKLKMLQKLDVSFNSIQGTLPEELGSLRKLQFLAVNDNMIMGPYPESMANIRGLQYLIMDNNPMNTTLPSFIGGYGSLMALSLSNSGHFGTIPSAYGTLDNLTVMSLDRNKLSGSIPKELGQLPHIYQLNLSLNNLSGAIPFTQEFVNKLGRNLDLSGNKGLCSEYDMTPMKSKPEGGLSLCSSSDLSNSSLSSSSSSSLATSTKKMVSSFSTSSLCILYTVIVLHF